MPWRRCFSPNNSHHSIVVVHRSTRTSGWSPMETLHPLLAERGLVVVTFTIQLVSHARPPPPGSNNGDSPPSPPLRPVRTYHGVLVGHLALAASPTTPRQSVTPVRQRVTPVPPRPGGAAERSTEWCELGWPWAGDRREFRVFPLTCLDGGQRRARSGSAGGPRVSSSPAAGGPRAELPPSPVPPCSRFLRPCAASPRRIPAPGCPPGWGPSPGPHSQAGPSRKSGALGGSELLGRRSGAPGPGSIFRTLGRACALPSPRVPPPVFPLRSPLPYPPPPPPRGVGREEGPQKGGGEGRGG